MAELLENKWLLIGGLLILGVIIGFVVIKPILNRFRKKALNKDLPYLAHLFDTLMTASPIFGGILLLNLLQLNPLDLSLKASFLITLKVLNAILATFILAEILVFVYDKYSNRKTDNKVSTLFHIIIRLLIYFAGIIIISGILDYDIKAMLTALGVGGLAVALALQDTLSNLFAGMHILASRQLKPGDYIKIEETVEGYVLDINWRNTTIKTLLENVIIIPNSKISTTITTNYFTLQKNLYFHVPVGVHYNSDLERVEKVTLEVANQVLSNFPGVPNNFVPKVRFYEFAESSINLKVWMTTDLYENHIVIQHQFIKALQERYRREGIEIPYPMRTVHLSQEN